MNGNGIQPTIELATNNGNGYAYPVYPMMYGNGGFGNSGFFGNDAIWLIILLALFGGFGNNGNGFGGGFNNDYAWLSNGQKDIMTNTNQGFDTLHLSNQLDSTQQGIYGISNQLCNSTSDIVGALNGGFSNAEISANARQMANMQQAFNNQITTLQGFNTLGSQFADCCCENRLGIANLNSTILAENCADREALSNGIRDLITNQNAVGQRILDQLCQDKIDSKNEKINDLQREILMKDLQASQVAQTADIRTSQAVTANQLVAELRSCPIPSQPVYGNQPIFSCNNNGCGCNGNYLYN